VVRESNIALRQRAFPGVDTVNTWIAMEPTEVFSHYPKIYEGMVKPLLELDPDYDLLMAVLIKDYTLKSSRCPRSDTRSGMKIFAWDAESRAAAYPALSWLERHLSAGTLPPGWKCMSDVREACAFYKRELIYPLFHLSGKCFYTFARHWHALMREIGVECRMECYVCDELGLDEYPSDLPRLM
jgi:hypothetical protein